MNIPLLEPLFKIFNIELPRHETMDEYLDFITPKISQYSEDVSERAYLENIRWKEVREGDQFHESILHFFAPGGEYMLTIDGNIMKGTWRQLADYNTIILEIAGKSELFDNVFLNGQFFVLRKHGDQVRKGQRKYFFLANESRTRGPNGPLEWREIIELLFNVYRENNSPFTIIVALILLLVAGILYASWF